MNDTTVALVMLLGVLVVAATTTRAVAVVASLIAFGSYNFFFLPPVRTFAIHNRDDLVALFALLAVALIGSQLSHLARRRAQEAVAMAEQRNAAELARLGAEARSAIVASLAHDLKTPLTALTVAASNLRSTGLSSDDRAEQLRILDGELARLRRLFDKVVDMASVETHAAEPHRQWVTAAELIDAARRQAAAQLSTTPITIGDATDPYEWHIDPRITSAALAHVLENAALYSGGDLPISITIQAIGNRVVIAVRDRGPGLPEGDLDLVFERYYRSPASPHHAFSSGMGLAIARGLLGIQGGRISAANHPGGGAVFTIDVPAERRPRADVEAALG